MAGSSGNAVEAPTAPKCSYCGRLFSRAEHLARHERSRRYYVSPLQAFSDADAYLDRKEKPFRCSICDACFGRKDVAKRHHARYHGHISLIDLPPASATPEECTRTTSTHIETHSTYGETMRLFASNAGDCVDAQDEPPVMDLNDTDFEVHPAYNLDDTYSTIGSMNPSHDSGFPGAFTTDTATMLPELLSENSLTPSSIDVRPQSSITGPFIISESKHNQLIAEVNKFRRPVSISST